MAGESVPRNRAGYRGYVGSRPVRGVSYPQRVQNLVVRDYATRRGLPFKLSLTENSMPASYMMLHDLMDELPSLEGAVFFSLFMLPESKKRRFDVYRHFIDGGAHLHFALEELVLRTEDDIPVLEDLMAAVRTLPHTPSGGLFDKRHADHLAGDFWAVMREAAVTLPA